MIAKAGRFVLNCACFAVHIVLMRVGRVDIDVDVLVDLDTPEPHVFQVHRSPLGPIYVRESHRAVRCVR